MVDKIIEDYYAGEKIRNKKRGKDSYFTKQGMEAVILSDYAKETLSELLTYPQNFELYQEPEKTWIHGEEFKGSIEELFLSDKVLTSTQAGAIALAKEFLSRWITYTCPIEIITELVGRENLE